MSDVQLNPTERAWGRLEFTLQKDAADLVDGTLWRRRLKAPSTTMNTSMSLSGQMAVRR
eukprot:m.105350 g.105350  ORF g.105350 m.105350 type:complete len:59 (-) comp15706_c1_seq1:335-511(-)